ncbi:RNA-binding protein isoform 1 [Dorcoceras hygrometricum]|uniref:RNA-binding protein isoform 1 n=1 Tax=Dorcoceras hygrometricum TaxID=472368 RepID=A0A2Z7C0N6_9LAMI|nr:RNA-binding protein isoform 1 [Dorcoceras hygrometricum]
MDQRKDSETLASTSKLNAKAPEFIPRSTVSTPPQRVMQIYAPPPYYAYENHLPMHNFNRQSTVSFYGNVRPVSFTESREDSNVAATSARNGLPDSHLKILNQVEFYFSDINLASTDQLFRLMCKDPEAYVPLSFVASFKKIKNGVCDSSQLASILRNSKKLVVSEDGKKIKRKHPLTELDMEELQSRIVIAENLPEEHCHQNLMNIFSSVGSVKSIRTCPPQNPNFGTSSASRTGKGDVLNFSSKFHAFVEYESAEVAEKAAVELTDEGNWRNGLKVRLLKSVLKSTQVRARRVGYDGQPIVKKDEVVPEMQQMKENHLEDSLRQFDVPFSVLQVDDNICGNAQGRGLNGVGGKGKGKGMGRGRTHFPMNGGSLSGPPPLELLIPTEKLVMAKISPVPRMPDGTRGFSMGRGKPVALNVLCLNGTRDQQVHMIIEEQIKEALDEKNRVELVKG